MRNKNIKDLTSYLDKKTGLDADEREQWRQCIDKLKKEVDAEKDVVKKQARKEEVMRVFNSMSYWKSKYKKHN